MPVTWIFGVRGGAADCGVGPFPAGDVTGIRYACRSTRNRSACRQCRGFRRVNLSRLDTGREIEITGNHMVTYSADPFRAVADPTRRAVLEYLLGKPHSVNELADHFDVSRPAISKHLRILKDARVVRERRDGRHRIYELNPEGLKALREYFDRFWSDALDAFKRAAEANAKRKT